MSLGNEIKKKKAATEAKALVNRAVSMSDQDWAILQNHLMLLQENIGRCGLASDVIGTVHGNCSYFINKINNENDTQPNTKTA